MAGVAAHRRRGDDVRAVPAPGPVQVGGRGHDRHDLRPLVDPQARELRKRREELLRQQLERRRAQVVGRLDLPAEVVDRVVPAPEDPVVVGQPVVVELVGAVADPLPVSPADRDDAWRKAPPPSRR